MATIKKAAFTDLNRDMEGLVLTGCGGAAGRWAAEGVEE